MLCSRSIYRPCSQSWYNGRLIIGRNARRWNAKKSRFRLEAPFFPERMSKPSFLDAIHFKITYFCIKTLRHGDPCSIRLVYYQIRKRIARKVEFLCKIGNQNTLKSIGYWRTQNLSNNFQSSTISSCPDSEKLLNFRSLGKPWTFIFMNFFIQLGHYPRFNVTNRHFEQYSL